MKMVHIPANPSLPATLIDRDGSLSILQELVGGNIESVGRHFGAAAYCNEEGALGTPLMPSGLPINVQASVILADLFGTRQTIIRGDVVIVGIDPGGRQVDVPGSIEFHVDDLEEEVIEPEYVEPEEDPDDARDRLLDQRADQDASNWL